MHNYDEFLFGLVIGSIVALALRWLFSGTDEVPTPAVTSDPDPEVEEETGEEGELADLPEDPAFPAGNFWIEFDRSSSLQPWAVYSIQRIVANEAGGPLFWCYSREDATALAEKMSSFENDRLADIGQVQSDAKES